MPLRLVLSSICMLLLALPAAAQADMYCVSNPDCVDGGGIATGGIQQALDAAEVDPGDDVVWIGPGTFTGKLIYSATGKGSIEVFGSGRDETTLALPAILAPGAALAFAGDSGDVYNLSITLPNTTSEVTGLAGVRAIESVDIAGGGGAGVTGVVFATDAALFRNGDIDLAAGVSGLTRGVVLNGGENPLLENLQVDLDGAESVGLSSTNTSTTINRATISAHTGIYAEDSLDVYNSLLRQSAGGNNNIGLLATSNDASDTTVNAAHVTVIGNGDSGSIGMSASSQSTGTASINLDNSILASVAHSYTQNASSSNSISVFNSSYTSYNPATSVATGDGAHNGIRSNTLSATDEFVSGTDAHLRYDSPLIDAGDPAPVAVGEIVRTRSINSSTASGQAFESRLAR